MAQQANPQYINVEAMVPKLTPRRRGWAAGQALDRPLAHTACPALAASCVSAASRSAAAKRSVCTSCRSSPITRSFSSSCRCSCASRSEGVLCPPPTWAPLMPPACAASAALQHGNSPVHVLSACGSSTRHRTPQQALPFPQTHTNSSKSSQQLTPPLWGWPALARWGLWRPPHLPCPAHPPAPCTCTAPPGRGRARGRSGGSTPPRRCSTHGGQTARRRHNRSRHCKIERRRHLLPGPKDCPSPQPHHHKA